MGSVRTGRVAVAVGLLTIAAASPARAGVDDPQGRVVFARGSSLWATDPRGKVKAVEVVALPPGAVASDVRTVRSNAAGDRIVVDVGGTWFWTTLVPDGVAALTELPCAPGATRLSAKGASVLCAGPDGKARMVRLADGKVFERDAPAAAASLVVRGDVRSMAWIDAQSRVVVAPVIDPTKTEVLAPVAPVRGFLAAPDGSRGVGIYRAKPLKPKDAPERDELFGFALDGTAARRRLIRDGVVLDWSWDSHWLLVQDGDKACIARATGGQFKCWKGYTAVSIAPDGAYALVLGPRSGAAAAAPADDEKESGEGEGEGESDAHGDEEVVGALPKGPLSLYRAKLNGPYTERPSLVETIIDGAAVWLPMPSTSETSQALPLPLPLPLPFYGLPTPIPTTTTSSL